MAKKLIWIAAISLFLSSTAGAAPAGAIPKRYVLDSGMIVILKEIRTSPAPVVSLQIRVKAGAVTEAEYSGSGISHLVEHMLFKGTKKRGVGQIAQDIRAAGGEIGGYTSFDETVYHLTLPGSQLDIGLDVLADAVMNTTFDQEELKKEQQVILKEINMNQDEPERYLSRKFWEIAYSTHPYRYPIIGYQSLFEGLTREDVIKYYQRMYIPNNLILTIAGDFDPVIVLSKVKAGFKDFRQQSLAPVYIPTEPRQLGMKRVVEEYQVELAYLKMGFHIPSIRSEDMYPLDILAIILGQGKTSRLFKEVKDSKQLVYTINAWSYTPAYPGIFGIDATLEPENLEKTERAILDEINKIKSRPVTNKELATAKKKVISQHVFAQEAIDDQVSDLGSNELDTGNINFSTEYVARINQVTGEEIKAVANQYFTMDNLTLVGLIPEVDISTATPSLPPSPPSITKTVLDNGLTLLVRENPHLPIITIKAVFKGGVCFEPEGKNGVCQFAGQMLLKGTKKRSKEELARIIESKGGQISTYSGNNSFGCSVSMLKDDLDIGLDILADAVTNPAFPKEEMEKERKLILASIRNQEDDLFAQGLKTLKSILWLRHPYRFQSIGSKESVTSISQADLISFHQNHCRPNNMVLSISGDVESKLVIEKAKQVFGSFKQRNLPDAVIPTEPEQKESRRVVIEKDKKQALILLGFHGTSLFNPDRYPLEVMNAILSGQNSRLFNTIREKQGLAYYVGAYSILGLYPGAYLIYLGTVAEKIEEALASLWKEIEGIKTEEVSEQELNMAKKNLIGQKMIELQTNEAYAFEMGLDELYGLGYNNIEKYEDKINQVSKQDIKRVANKYLESKANSLVIIKPKGE